MSQTFLDENPPMILDATCSEWKRWPRFATLRFDIRREAEPDVQADVRHLPLRDSICDEVYFDPPFYVGKPSDFIFNRPHDSTHRFNAYGWMESRPHWLKFLYGANKELRRVLKPSGSLHVKLTFGDGFAKKTETSLLSDFTRTKTQVLPRTNLISKAETQLITMRPKP